MLKINGDISNKNCLDKIIIISGATATGKSAVALDLSKQINGAIINADALQIYRELPILSAQPARLNMEEIEHYLYGIFDATQKISVGIWLDMVKNSIGKILNYNQVPIIVGGSGMYISRLIDGIAKIPDISQEIHNEVLNLYNKIGHIEFCKKFGTAKIIDKQKLLRRAEVFIQTGRNIDDFFLEDKQKILENFNIIHLNLNPSRDKIYQNCNDRFEKMLRKGAIEEVKNFINIEPNFLNLTISKTLGFEEISSFLQEKINYEQMIKLGSQKTRNYAKRQLTWFRHQFNQIIFCENERELIKKVLIFLKS